MQLEMAVVSLSSIRSVKLPSSMHVEDTKFYFHMHTIFKHHKILVKSNFRKLHVCRKLNPVLNFPFEIFVVLKLPAIRYLIKYM